jgi:cytochrome b pre-mRNA-processing protein 3
MPLLGMFRRRQREREAFALYTGAVQAARQPAHYAALGVPDKLEGRFDLVTFHVALLVRRLRSESDPRGAALAQGVFDAMFLDMDLNLREMGVSDMIVGKRMKRLWEAFHGRAVAYEAALDGGDRAALADALARNLWRCAEPGMVDGNPGEAAHRLAALGFEQAAHLATQPLAALAAGEVRFLPVAVGEAPDDAA